VRGWRPCGAQRSNCHLLGREKSRGSGSYSGCHHSTAYAACKYPVVRWYIHVCQPTQGQTRVSVRGGEFFHTLPPCLSLTPPRLPRHSQGVVQATIGLPAGPANPTGDDCHSALVKLVCDKLTIESSLQSFTITKIGPAVGEMTTGTIKVFKHFTQTMGHRLC